MPPFANFQEKARGGTCHLVDRMLCYGNCSDLVRH